ncbi:MAG: hypothetical protein IJA03_07370, partial [Bacteroidaceae bacterium]|nr:hypothetical protein [Bacteroidaceae bacterium]
FKFFCILLPSLLKTNVCFYHIYLFKLREAKVEETEIIDNIESWRRLRKHSLPHHGSSSQLLVFQ